MATDSAIYQLKWLREGRKLNQEQAGALIGISQTAYSALERGVTKLGLTEIQKFADAYDVDRAIFTTDIPESEWGRFLNFSNRMAEPVPGYKGTILEESDPPVVKMKVRAAVLQAEVEMLRNESAMLNRFIGRLEKEVDDKEELIKVFSKELANVGGALANLTKGI